MINHEELEVVIVGAGAAGNLFAAKLSEAGKNVVVLEAGPPRQLKDLFSSEIWARRIKWTSDPVASTGTAPLSITYNAGGGFGGSALHHLANWFRLHPEDFKEKSLYGEHQDWPIEYADLRKFYDEIQTEIGISGDTEAETTRPPSAPYPMPPLQHFAQSRIFNRGAAVLGIETFAAPQAINSVEYKGRNACLLDGWCDAGCPIGALANPLVTNMPQALAAGVEFRSYASVTKVLTDGSGKYAKGVVYVDQEGQEHFQPASVVILAAYALSIPRILLYSTSSQFPNGLANSSGIVGQFISAHITARAFALFEEDTEPYLGVAGGGMVSQSAYDRKQNSGYFGSYTLIAAPALKPNDLLGIANTRTDLFGAPLDTFLKQASQHINNAFSIAETTPQAQNRVTLSSQTDAYGVPLAQVTHGFSANDMRINTVAGSQALSIFTAAGASQVWAGQTIGQHILGGAIMGADPETSVTNGYGQTHDVSNLFIAGSSLFPTTGAVNPTFTIYALAARAVGYMLDNWGSIARAG